jgi:hypothetical protein
MELLVGAIVLRLGAAGEIHPNAQAHPPQAQSGAAVRSSGSKGLAVVQTDGGWQAEAFEEAQEGGAQGPVTEIGENLDGQNHAGEEVAHGQWLTALSIAGPEGPFKVYGPNVVGTLRDLETLAVKDGTWAGAVDAAALQSVMSQVARDAARARNRRRGQMVDQKGAQLLGSPSRMSVAQGDDAFEKGSWRAPWCRGRTTPTVQTTGAVLGKTLDPFMDGLTADAETLGERGNGFALFRGGLDETKALFEQRGFRT